MRGYSALRIQFRCRVPVCLSFTLSMSDYAPGPVTGPASLSPRGCSRPFYREIACQSPGSKTSSRMWQVNYQETQQTIPLWFCQFCMFAQQVLESLYPSCSMTERAASTSNKLVEMEGMAKRNTESKIVESLKMMHIQGWHFCLIFS